MVYARGQGCSTGSRFLRGLSVELDFGKDDYDKYFPGQLVLDQPHVSVRMLESAATELSIWRAGNVLQKKGHALQKVHAYSD